MGIDGIGGGGFKPGGPGGPSGAAGPQRKERTFEVGGSESTQGVEAASTPELDRLQSGEISLDQYLDQRVDQAVSHLTSALSPEQLDTVRKQLREQMSTDPMLQKLIHRATGVSPSEQS